MADIKAYFCGHQSHIKGLYNEYGDIIPVDGWFVVDGLSHNVPITDVSSWINSQPQCLGALADNVSVCVWYPPHCGPLPQ